jgi:hypothetical protein
LNERQVLMAQQRRQSSPKSIQLHEEAGETSRYIQAEIRQDGDLVLSGQDVGRAPREFWGDSDYEWWVSVSSNHKDDVLLALLEKLYGGNPAAIEEFRDLLEARGIKSEFHSWT